MDGDRLQYTSLLIVLTLLTAGCAQSLPEEVPQPTATPGGGAPATPWVTSSPSVDPISGNLTLEVLDVGQGDAIMLHTSGGAMLVDTGDRAQASYQPLLDHLAQDAVDRLAALVITHPDADHAGGCDEVIETVPVDLVLHPGQTKTTRTWETCQAAIRNEGAPVLTDTRLGPGDHLNVSLGVEIEILWLDAHAEDPNEGSLVLRVDHQDTSAMLTGDIGCETEDRLVASGRPVDVDLLKVGHHGSAGSTCEAWLDATTPRLAAISAGAENPYGHPHGETLERLTRHGVQIHRTDTDGTLAFTTDGTTWATIHSESPPPTEPAGNASVTITRIQADPPGNDNDALDQEWVALTNALNRSVDLGGWTLEDDAGHTYHLPAGTQLEANATLRVHTGYGDDNATDLYWGHDQAVWNNGGDTATLRDAERALVDTFSYG